LYKNVVGLAKVANKVICDSRVLRSKPPMCACGIEDLLGKTLSPNWPILTLGIGEGT
jgi:hypothetical protein